MTTYLKTIIFAEKKPMKRPRKDLMIKFRLSADEKAHIAEMARRKGSNFSNYFRDLIKNDTLSMESANIANENILITA